MTTDLLAELNDQQRAAVTAPDGPALVIAAAGTGKTRTLTHRVAWLVREQNIRPWNILLLTFTNRAAKEMLERAGQLLGGKTESLWGGTFHSVANRMLRHHADRLGYDRSFAILDEDDSARLLKQCIADLGLGKDKKFPKPDILHGLIGLAASRQADLRDTLAERFSDPSANLDGMIEAAARYADRKREVQGMDFDDLLSNALRLLRECPDVLDHYGKTFRHILVDEYQDTSRIQSDFVDLLSGVHNNLMAVGDDFQSIYSWRGAEIDNFLSFGKRHPGATIYKLERNYRSVPGVLAVANDVVAGAAGQFAKTLVPDRGEGVRPTLVHLSDGRHQARYVVDKAMQLIQSGEVPPGEIAVLYRSHFHAMELQLELARAQLPYTVVSGVRFFEQAHVKDVCAPLQLAANPSNFLAFSRWMELLPKVGPKRAETMWTKLGGRIDLRSPDARAALSKALPADAQPAWRDIADALFPGGDASLLDRPEGLVKAFCSSFYGDYIDATFDNPRSRKEDLTELCSFCAKYPSTAAFLEEMTLLTNVDSGGRAGDDRDARDTIRLTTVHQAKGLEWRAVFVLWTVHGMFPSARASDDPKSMAEERRLFYVAVTRAKDYLWLCAPNMRYIPGSGPQYCALSPFVEGIDPSKLQTDRPVTPAPAWGGSEWYGAGRF